MKYIVELSQPQLRAIAKGLHLLLADNEKHHAAKSALDTLIVQSHHVYRDPKKHDVFKDALTAPPVSKPFSQVYHMPINIKREN